LVKRIFIFGLFFSFLFSQEVKVVLSQNKISTSQSLTLSIEIKNTEDNPEVDISEVLSNFSIVSGPSLSSEYRFINGIKSSSRKLSWILIPLREGVFTYENLNVKIGSKIIKTDKFQIEVTKDNLSQENSEEIFLKIDVSSKEIFVGEKATLTYTFFTRVPVKILSTEFPEFKEFWVEKIVDPTGKEILPEQWKDVDQNGYSYKYLKLYEVDIFPMSAGTFELQSMIIKAQTKNDDPNFKRLFWEDPFFDTFSQRTRANILVSNPVTIKVKNLEDSPKNFSGAVGEFSLQSYLSSDKFEVGVPFSFTLQMKGSGNFYNISRPNIVFSSDFDIFEGQTSIKYDISRNKEGFIQWEYNLIPRKEGQFEIPSIEFDYFNTNTEKWTKLKLDKKLFSVKKSYNDQRILRSINDSSMILTLSQQGSELEIKDQVVSNLSIFIILLSLIILFLIYSANGLKTILIKNFRFIEKRTSLARALVELNNSKFIEKDFSKILCEYLYKKNIIDRKNLDSRELLDILSEYLDDKHLLALSQIFKKFDEAKFGNIEENHEKFLDKLIQIFKLIEKST
jgi:hypothetical protein